MDNISAEMNKINGIIIFILSFSMGLFGVIAILNTSRMAEMSRLAINDFDQNDWALHWQISAVLFFVTGVTGIVSSIGIFKNKLWGYSFWVYLASTYLMFHCMLHLSYTFIVKTILDHTV